MICEKLKKEIFNINKIFFEVVTNRLKIINPNASYSYPKINIAKARTLEEDDYYQSLVAKIRKIQSERDIENKNLSEECKSSYLSKKLGNEYKDYLRLSSLMNPSIEAYIDKQGDIFLNKILFNWDSQSSKNRLVTDITHEILHSIRRQSMVYREGHRGYSNLSQSMRGLLPKSDEYKSVPTGIIEFFPEINGIIFNDVSKTDERLKNSNIKIEEGDINLAKLKKRTPYFMSILNLDYLNLIDKYKETMTSDEKEDILNKLSNFNKYAQSASLIFDIDPLPLRLLASFYGDLSEKLRNFKNFNSKNFQNAEMYGNIIRAIKDSIGLNESRPYNIAEIVINENRPYIKNNWDNLFFESADDIDKRLFVPIRKKIKDIRDYCMKEF